MWPLFFFFSSRRRHTRSTRDWSSDVCSSDLGELDHLHQAFLARRTPGGGDRAPRAPVLRGLAVSPGVQVAPRAPRAAVPRLHRRRARASRRACARDAGGAGSESGRARAAVTVGPLRSRIGELERTYLSGTFAELCRIESPSGSARACAE